MQDEVKTGAAGTAAQDEREAFERWMHTFDLPPALAGEVFNDPQYPEADCFGQFVYADHSTQRCWAAWQARADRTEQQQPIGFASQSDIDWQGDMQLRRERRDDYQVPVFAGAVVLACSCPTGDGSLRWPCLSHPAASAQTEPDEPCPECDGRGSVPIDDCDGVAVRVCNTCYPDL